MSAYTDAEIRDLYMHAADKSEVIMVLVDLLQMDPVRLVFKLHNMGLRMPRKIIGAINNTAYQPEMRNSFRRANEVLRGWVR